MNSNKTYLRGWLCSDEWMQSATFAPWVNVDDMSKELDENCELVAVLVSNKERSMEDVIEAIDKVERINKNIVWFHPFLVGSKIVGGRWLLIAVDRPHCPIGDDAMTVAMKTVRNYGWELIADQ